MTYKTHAAFGALLAGGAVALAGHGLMPLVVIAGAIGGVLPDIDHDKSKISNVNPAVRGVGIVYRLFLRAVALLMRIAARFLRVFGLRIATTTGGHRGPLTHSLLAVGIFALLLTPVRWASPYWYAGMVIGVLSHVLIDSLNPQGIPAFWPLHVGVRGAGGEEREFRMRLLPESLSPTTGTFGETLVFGLLLVAGMVAIAMATQHGGIGLMDLQGVMPGLDLSVPVVPGA